MADIVPIYTAERCCAGNGAHADAAGERNLKQLSDETVQELASSFKVLADPTRIRILSTLAQRELCVCDLAEVLGMNQSAVSHQLRYLRAMRLVKSRREGNTIYYTHDDAHTMGLLQMATDHVAHVQAETPNA